MDLLDLSGGCLLIVICITGEGLLCLWLPWDKSIGLLVETIVRLHTELVWTYLIHAESWVITEVELVGLRRHEILSLLLLVRDTVMRPFALIVRLLVRSEILWSRSCLRHEDWPLIAILH